MIPHERSLVKRLEGKPFAIVGINSDRPDDYQEKVRTMSIPWRSFKDKRDGEPTISKQWQINAWPTLYLIDHSGVIRHRWEGGPPEHVLDRAIEELLEAAIRESKAQE